MRSQLLDIVIYCLGGILRASSQILATNSVVFEKMLFSLVQMQEAKTSIVYLADVAFADMELLLKFCLPHQSYSTLLETTTVDTIMSVITVAHRFEFEFALPFLCKRLLELVEMPTATQIQFVERYELDMVLSLWAVKCASPSRHHKFIIELAEHPLDPATVKLFADKHFEHAMTPKCMRYYVKMQFINQFTKSKT